MSLMETVDIAVIGGGIAGISAAFHLATALPDQSVRVFEAESSLTHHSTGRSAAVWIENYGPMAVRPLTRASRAFFNGGAADDFDGFSGDQGGPPFPGEDFIVNAPEGVEFPTDLTEATIVISVEPDPDDSPAPFALKPLVSEVADGIGDHQFQSFGAGPAAPTGTATIGG